MSPRFIVTKLLGSLATLAFVVVFNFFLFRVVDSDPVANLFRGRNLNDSQRAQLVHDFGLDGSQFQQFLHYLRETASLNFGRSYVTNQPVMSEIVDKAMPTIVLVGISAVLSALFGVLIGINFGFVLSGAIAVEAIFSWPGLGLATYDALGGPDLPMLQGLFLVFSAAAILFNLLADLLYAYVDPRVRTA